MMMDFVILDLCSLHPLKQQWVTQTCDCGSNLHCRLLADWIHHDVAAFRHNISQTAPPKPNSFKMENKRSRKRKRGEVDDDADRPLIRRINSIEEDPGDFYIRRRTNGDEVDYYHEMSRKYVHCARCQCEISAYQFVFICNNRDHEKGTVYLCGKCSTKQCRDLKVPLFPKCEENVEICLLFVAHDGISQPALWMKWLNEKDGNGMSIRHKFGVAVQCNNFEKLKSGKSFAETFRIDVQRPTSWGKLLVPLTIQKSLQIALTKYPNCRRFYIISGREIPLVSAAHILSMPDKTQLMAKKITKQLATKLGKKRMGKLLQWYSHHVE